MRKAWARVQKLHERLAVEPALTVQRTSRDPDEHRLLRVRAGDEKFMTTTPHSIGVEQPLSRAHAMMREHGVRHLPVLHAGKLLGMLTERDLQLVESLEGVDPTKE